MARDPFGGHVGRPDPRYSPGESPGRAGRGDPRPADEGVTGRRGAAPALNQGRPTELTRDPMKPPGAVDA
jgi:hypothetical protein